MNETNLLHPTASAASSGRDDAAVMYLGPLGLPEYVARTQIVTRGDGVEMIVDDYHRRAESLDDAIPRIVAVNGDNSSTG